MTSNVMDVLGRQRVLPVLRLPTGRAAVEAAVTAVDAGLAAVELTATTPDWESCVRQVARERPHALVGVGTVTTLEAAERALDAGVAFVVSPWPAPEVRRIAESGDVTFIEGAFSPGEVANGAARGPVKVFPAHVGGPAYLSSIRQLLPDAVLVPTGGIRLAEVPEWLAAGARAVGVGSDLLAGDMASRVAAILASVDDTQEARA